MTFPIKPTAEKVMGIALAFACVAAMLFAVWVWAWILWVTVWDAATWQALFDVPWGEVTLSAWVLIGLIGGSFLLVPLAMLWACLLLWEDYCDMRSL